MVWMSWPCGKRGKPFGYSKNRGAASYSVPTTWMKPNASATISPCLCDHIAIIVGGKIVVAGSPQALMQQAGKDNLEDAFVALAGGREGLARSQAE